MKIKILNKNNNTVYDVDDGAVFTEVYNETLDTGTVTISNLSSPIQIEPYDIVEIYKTGESLRWKYMCVDTYTEIMECVNPKLYKYEISLFSETKQLEGIVLPNLKITKVWGETRTIWYYINQYMDEYGPKIRSHTYGSNYIYTSKFERNTSELLDKFNYTECPEMQWNTPTLREVLNDLMMVVDCIPVIKDATLSFIDLTKTFKPTSETLSKINYVTKSRSSEDYVSELQVPLVNVTNKEDNQNVLVTRSEYFTLTTSDDNATLTTENCLVKTLYPIYNLKSIVMMFPCYLWTSGSPSSQHFWIKQNLMNINGTNLVCEKQKWLTKNIAYNQLPPSSISNWTKYQNWTLYYTRGSNEINNFYSKTKYFWTTNFLLKELSKYLGMMRTGSESNYPNGPNAGNTICGYMFKIEYETLQGCLFRASKGELPEHDRIVIDNQTNSYVDSYSQGFLEYQKANRLGNEQLQINARYLPSETTLKIGDIYEDSIIYQCQYQCFRDHTEVNAQATKNYVLREYFTGVKSKIRSWKIADGSEALQRHDLIKYYCEFSYNRHRELVGLDTLTNNNVIDYFISPCKSYTSNPLKYAFVRINIGNSTYQPKIITNNDITLNINTYYSLDLIDRSVGNSLIFNFSFLDNTVAGQSFHTESDYNGETPDSDDKYIKTSDIVYTTDGYDIKNDIKTNGGIPLYQHKYTDDNGEFISGEAYLCDNIKTIPNVKMKTSVGGTDIYLDYTDTEPVDGDNWLNTSNWEILSPSKNFSYFAFIKPRIYEGSFKYTGVDSSSNINYDRIHFNFNFKKDSQEITAISTQFEFCSETNDICFGKEWIKRQQAVNVNNNSLGYVLNVYDKSLYDFRNPNKLPDGTYSQYLLKITTDTSNNSTAMINIGLINAGGHTYSEALNNIKNALKDKCAYLTTLSGDVLLAFNNIPEDSMSYFQPAQIGDAFVPFFSIYLNLLKNRNKNIYGSNKYLIHSKI